MDDETVRLTIRLPDDMHARLKQAAACGYRSLNEQMLAYLAAGLDQDKIPREPPGG